MCSFSKQSINDGVAERLRSLENAVGNMQPRVGSLEHMTADLLPLRDSKRSLPVPSVPVTGHRGYPEPARGRTMHMKIDTPETRPKHDPETKPKDNRSRRAQSLPPTLTGPANEQALRSEYENPFAMTNNAQNPETSISRLNMLERAVASRHR